LSGPLVDGCGMVSAFPYAANNRLRTGTDKSHKILHQRS
jgi:hypothetical protein